MVVSPGLLALESLLSLETDSYLTIPDTYDVFSLQSLTSSCSSSCISSSAVEFLLAESFKFSLFF